MVRCFGVIPYYQDLSLGCETWFESEERTFSPSYDSETPMATLLCVRRGISFTLVLLLELSDEPEFLRCNGLLSLIVLLD